MKEIPLTRGHVALVDDEDFDRINAFKWRSSAQGSQKKPYAVRTIDKRKRKRDPVTKKRLGEVTKIWMHREIMNTPDDLVCDHSDGNGLNNQKSNLENVTFEENFRRSQEKRFNPEDFVL